MSRRDVMHAAGSAGRAGAGCAWQLAIAVFGLGMAALLFDRARLAFDPMERAARADEIYRAQRFADDLYAARLWAGWAWQLAPALGATVLLTGLSGVLVLMVYRRWATWEMLRAEKLVSLTRAQVQQFPAGLQSLAFNDSSRPQLAAAAPAALVAPPAALPLGAPPTFAALLDAGQVGQGRPLLLGYDRETGEPVEGSWLDLYSTAVGGLSGTGKSWTAAFLACQAALQGSRLIIIDPHAESPESLAARLAPMRGRFVCDPASTPDAMLAAVRLAAAELGRRKAGGYVRGSAPIVVVADEFAALQRGELAEPLAQLVEALGQEGRKLDLYGMVCSQVWSSERAGGTPLRDSLASAYIHRLRPAQARMLSGLTSAELPDDLFSLPKGQAYLVTTGGELRAVVIPQMTPADVARVAELTGGAPPAAAPSSRPIGFRPGGASGGASGGAETEPHRGRSDAANLTPEEARILAAFLDGKSASELAAELNGGKRSGDGFNQAARRVAEVLRKALGKGAA